MSDYLPSAGVHTKINSPGYFEFDSTSAVVSQMFYNNIKLWNYGAINVAFRRVIRLPANIDIIPCDWVVLTLPLSTKYSWSSLQGNSDPNTTLTINNDNSATLRIGSDEQNNFTITGHTATRSFTGNIRVHHPSFDLVLDPTIPVLDVGGLAIVTAVMNDLPNRYLNNFQVEWSINSFDSTDTKITYFTPEYSFDGNPELHISVGENEDKNFDIDVTAMPSLIYGCNNFTPITKRIRILADKTEPPPGDIVLDGAFTNFIYTKNWGNDNIIEGDIIFRFLYEPNEYHNDIGVQVYFDLFAIEDDIYGLSLIEHTIVDGWNEIIIDINLLNLDWGYRYFGIAFAYNTTGFWWPIMEGFFYIGYIDYIMYYPITDRYNIDGFNNSQYYASYIDNNTLKYDIIIDNNFNDRWNLLAEIKTTLDDVSIDLLPAPTSGINNVRVNLPNYGMLNSGMYTWGFFDPINNFYYLPNSIDGIGGRKVSFITNNAITFSGLLEKNNDTIEAVGGLNSPVEVIPNKEYYVSCNYQFYVYSLEDITPVENTLSIEIVELEFQVEEIDTSLPNWWSNPVYITVITTDYFFKIIFFESNQPAVLKFTDLKSNKETRVVEDAYNLYFGFENPNIGGSLLLAHDEFNVSNLRLISNNGHISIGNSLKLDHHNSSNISEIISTINLRFNKSNFNIKSMFDRTHLNDKQEIAYQIKANNGTVTPIITSANYLDFVSYTDKLAPIYVGDDVLPPKLLPPIFFKETSEDILIVEKNETYTLTNDFEYYKYVINRGIISGQGFLCITGVNPSTNLSYENIDDGYIFSSIKVIAKGNCVINMIDFVRTDGGIIFTRKYYIESIVSMGCVYARGGVYIPGHVFTMSLFCKSLNMSNDLLFYKRSTTK